MFSNVNNPISAAITVLVPQRGELREAICSYILDQEATRYTALLSQNPQREGNGTRGLVERPLVGMLELVAPQRGAGVKIWRRICHGAGREGS